MHTAGFNPQGFVSMFDKLQAASRLNDDGAFPYLRSHPLTTERMADMTARTQELASSSGTASGAAQPSSGPISLPYHTLISARARVLAEDQTDRLRALAVTATTARTTGFDELQSFGQLYAATLAASRLRDARLVQLGLQQLLAHPLATTNDQTRNALAAFEVESWLALPPESWPAAAQSRVQQYVANTLALGPRATREAMVLSAQVLLKPAMASEAQRAQQSALAQRLQAHVALNPTDALAWQTLSKLHQAQGQLARAARADAESKLAHLDTTAALDRLRAAQQMARQGGANHIESSIIDARLRQVQDQLRQEQLDAR
jgi:predicted Zn-dependent protease